MVKASEIRKRVREAESERIKARSDAAVEVGTLHERVAAARAALTAAEGDLRKSVKAATDSHGYTLTELAQVTGVSAAALRSTQPASGNSSNGQTSDQAPASAPAG